MEQLSDIHIGNYKYTVAYVCMAIRDATIY